MLVLFDHSTPAPLAPHLDGHTVVEAKDRGWDRLSNGELPAEAERAGFEVLLTADTGMPYQQNLKGRKIALVILTGNSWRLVQRVIRENRCCHQRGETGKLSGRRSSVTLIDFPASNYHPDKWLIENWAAINSKIRRGLAQLDRGEVSLNQATTRGRALRTGNDRNANAEMARHRDNLKEGAPIMANSLDWSQCSAVESIPGKVSGAGVFRGTRVPVSAILLPRDAGAGAVCSRLRGQKHAAIRTSAGRMKILLDESVPQLLTAAEEAGFELFITADQEIAYQQKPGRPKDGPARVEHG